MQDVAHTHSADDVQHNDAHAIILQLLKVSWNSYDAEAH